MKRWQAFVALAGLFFLGVVSGALGAHLYYARALERPPGPPPFFAPFMAHHLERLLELSPEQREELGRIMADSRREAESLRHELAPRLHEVMERSDARIRELLTPEQLELYEEVRRSHRERAERFFGDGRRHRRRPHPRGG